MTTPASSFLLDDGIFEFEAEIDGVALKIEMTPIGDDSFDFEAEGEGANLTRIVNPINVRMRIGDDFAETKVNTDL